ncbi:hypothetical protein CPB84DRAFT_1781224 [Gymnopilus junonius]|uniref:Uncharacterized protein n=1 Tax=Gymnopilus junonius TaxID=109634 RepID=A0A9P5NLB9_GYMJU|nr:hypothetical protein CPB84DRAFT_1781224 [Gymnopilus junonius]
MSTTPTLSSILDPSHPLAYLAYLPPDVAYQVTIALYVLVAAVSIQIWDILNNLHKDYKILVKKPTSFPNVVYCTSRIFTLAYLLYAIIYESNHPIGNCEKLSKVGPWLVCIAIPSTSLLFFFRVHAMYNHHKYVSGFFFLMWLAVLGGSLTNVLGVAGFNIGPTKHCLNGTLKPYVSVGIIIQFVNDSLVFGAITLRLMQIGMEEEEMKLKDVLRVIILGKDLPAFTKALLRDGQVYYLTTSTFILMTFIIFYIDSIPLVYRTIFSIPNITLVNVMACRVYRRTKSGVYMENTTIELPLSFIRTPRAGRNNVVNLVGSQTSEMSNFGSAVFAVSKAPILDLGNSSDLSSGVEGCATRGRES